MSEYASIRDLMSNFIGQRLVEITQHDPDEYAETGQAYIMLMFENGNTIQITVGSDGIQIDNSEEE